MNTPVAVILPDPEVPYSWKNDYVTEARELGWEVVVPPIRDGRISLNDLRSVVSYECPDLLLWPRWGVNVVTEGQFPLHYELQDFFNECDSIGVATVGVHQDLYWGRPERDHFYDDAWFSMKYIFTADGDPKRKWSEVGINHFWLPPACPARFNYLGVLKKKYQYDVVFIGGCQPVHKGRAELLQWATKTYGKRFKWIGKTNAEQVWPPERNNLIASAKVILGDSVPGKYIWSDRVPTTVGAGGILVHPTTTGLWQTYGDHIHLYERGNYDYLGRKIDHLLSLSDNERMEMRLENIRWTATENTFRNSLNYIWRVVDGPYFSD